MFNVCVCECAEPFALALFGGKGESVGRSVGLGRCRGRGGIGVCFILTPTFGLLDWPRESFFYFPCGAHTSFSLAQISSDLIYFPYISYHPLPPVLPSTLFDFCPQKVLALCSCNCCCSCCYSCCTLHNLILLQIPSNLIRTHQINCSTFGPPFPPSL